MNRKIILIGGMPTAGKSTIARALADHFGIPWISTDQIREIMTVATSPGLRPSLFEAVDYTAEQFLEKYSPEEIAQLEYRQGEDVWDGIKCIINDWTWTKGCVIEGVSILPKMIAAEFKNEADFHAFFISDTDGDRLRDAVYNRGLFAEADKYSDDVKDKEIEWVRIFDNIIRREAEEHGYPVIEVSKDETDISRLISYI